MAERDEIDVLISAQGYARGLRYLILSAERPYADQNAMADIEGRPRPVVAIGIDRSPMQWWKTVDWSAI